MKRALVLSLAVVLGLGIAAFGQITGYWSSTFAIDPQPFTITSMSSTFKVDYALSGWTFGSVTKFDLNGYSSQAFKVAGSLGAFTLESNMSFAPAVVSERMYWWPVAFIYGDPGAADELVIYNVCPAVWTAWAWAPAFLTWDVTAGVTIAGVAIEAYVLQDLSAAGAKIYHDYLWNGLAFVDQNICASTADKGMGWRLMIAGSFGAVDITSYTYFNLTEDVVEVDICPAIGKSGDFYVGEGCGFPFTEEYLLIEGFTFGCATIDAALSIDCGGFAYVEFLVSDIALGNWGEFSFAITFTTTTKTVDTCIVLTPLAGPCFTVEIGGFQGTTLDTLTLYGFSFESVFGGVTFTSITELDAASELMSTATAYSYLNGPTVGFLVPFTGIETCATAQAAAVYYTFADGMSEVKCIAGTRYELWEKFVIDVDADACCGGLFGLTVSTFFGDEQILDFAAYAIRVAGALTYGAETYLYGTAGFVAPADLDTALAYDTVSWQSGYADGTQTTLFNWAKTTVALSVGISSNVEFSAGFAISVYGVDSMSLGFKWSF